MKNLTLLFLLLIGFASFAQVPALNETVKNNPPSASRIGAALEATEVYTASGTDTYTVSISVLGLYSGSATYAAGDQFTIVFTNANTTTTPTINAIPIPTGNATDIPAIEIAATTSMLAALKITPPINALRMLLESAC